MANLDHLNIIKQGVAVWNHWRSEHREITPDLSGANSIIANLSGANLREADLSRTDFTRADLVDADLSKAHLVGAKFFEAHLIGTSLVRADLRATNFHNADLHRANLFSVNLNDADLSGANLSDTNLHAADLSNANLKDANLRGAKLTQSNFSGVNLNKTILAEASIGYTIFGDVNLSLVKGLEIVKHEAPSTIGIDTIYSSQGNIPEVFLRKAGVPSSFIDYARSLVVQPIDFYSCFISYSSKDQDFAERLYADLQSEGVRCWFAPEDLKTGDFFWDRIDESIRLYDKLLVVLSQHSVESIWVRREIIAGLEKEDQRQQQVLFPIRLDETVMTTNKVWAADIRRQRHITDFTRWKNYDDYQRVFSRLIRDLKAEA